MSADEGHTWTQKDVGTTSNLTRVAAVNNVVYIGGDNIVLMSVDNGKTFVTTGKVEGNIKDINFTSTDTKPATFWAVPYVPGKFETAFTDNLVK
ncbi:hypothetical protein [Oligoflexus sp.]|uniref:hypothetical protein n=1 Tax=Oligoflexus sp. TaxID=1971216 RepID=UPI002D7686DA|nr:hypothetical protein [Oligoflexus sp.]